MSARPWDPDGYSVEVIINRYARGKKVSEHRSRRTYTEEGISRYVVIRILDVLIDPEGEDIGRLLQAEQFRQEIIQEQEWVDEQSSPQELPPSTNSSSS